MKCSRLTFLIALCHHCNKAFMSFMYVYMYVFYLANNNTNNKNKQ